MDILGILQTFQSLIEFIAKKFKQYFWQSSYEFAASCNKCYYTALSTIKYGLSAKFSLRALATSRLEKEFAERVRVHFSEFVKDKQLTDAEIEKLKGQMVQECLRLQQQKFFVFQIDSNHYLADETLVELLAPNQLYGLTKFLLNRFETLITPPLPSEFKEFLAHQNLLATGILFFLNQDETTRAQLQTLYTIHQATMLASIVKHFQEAGVHEQIAAEDGFKTYNDENRKKLLQAIALFKKTPFRSEEKGKALLMASSALFSLDILEESRKLLEEALPELQTDHDRALAHFNLFQIYLRYGTSEGNKIAFEHLLKTFEFDQEQAFYFYDPRKFKLLKLLGAGGMGCVFLAEDRFLQRQVVLKSFWKTFEQGKTESIMSEVEAMKRVPAQFIPQIFGVEFYQNHGYLLLEYIENAVDAEQWVLNQGKLTDDLAVEVTCQLANALQSAHQQGVLHLDLKPANVLLVTDLATNNISVKIIDFGLSKVIIPLERQIPRTQTQSSNFGQRLAGTWVYASPEQRGDQRYGKPSEKSDVFGFGKTIYRLCSGKDPDSMAEKSVPTLLRDLIFQCVEPDPQHRPALTDIIEQLRPFTQHERNLVTQQFEQWQLSLNEPVCKLGTLFEFDVITVDKTGKENTRVRRKNYQKIYELGQGITLEMVYIPAGEFWMGSHELEETQPVHKVKIAKPFYMGKYLVTQEQWQVIMGNNPSHFKGNKRPVELVNWYDAKAFCKKLSSLLNVHFDLPSESKWEYACRAGTTTSCYFGEEALISFANFNDAKIFTQSGYKLDSKSPNSGEKYGYRGETTEIGIFPPNGFGLHDMIGNLWEWCEDVWCVNYTDAPIDGSAVSEKVLKMHRSARGGSWVTAIDQLTCVARGGDDSSKGYFNSGLRVCSEQVDES